MIKDNQTRLNRLHVLLDALVIAAAYVFSWFITLKSGLFGADPEAGILPTWFYMRVLVVIIPVYLLLYTVFHLFTPKRGSGLILFDNVVIPFVDKYPTDTKTYAIMNTKPEESVKQEDVD